MGAEFFRFVKITYAEGGAAAALAFGQQGDGKTGGFEHGDGGAADVRFVVAHKGVVPENHAATLGLGAVMMFGKPMIKTFAGKFSQRPLIGEPEQPGHDVPH